MSELLDELLLAHGGVALRRRSVGGSTYLAAWVARVRSR
jgi:hypothetical protein